MSVYQKRAINAVMVAWPVFGFFRGMGSYDYEQKKRANYSYPEYTNTYLYSCRIAMGFTGAFVYIVPIFLPFTIAKELYRAEVVLRGLEKEKDTYYYNRILF